MWQATWGGLAGLWSKTWGVLRSGWRIQRREPERAERPGRPVMAYRRDFGLPILGLAPGPRSRRRASRRRMALERCEAREVFDADLHWQSAWQNPDVPADVVPDGIVAPADLLRIANSLAQYGEHALTGSESLLENWGNGNSSGLEYLDVTGDRWVTREDFETVLDVLEQLGDDPAMSALAPITLALDEITLALDETTLAVIGESASALRTTDSASDSGQWPSVSLAIGATVTSVAGANVVGVAPTIDISEGVVNPAPVTMQCANVPATAGPVPTMVLDTLGIVRPGNWRPAWTPLNDVANEGVIIDDFDSPYIALGSWQNYTDDNNMVAPKSADVPYVDDSHFAWLEIVGYRTYYVGTSLENVSNATTTPGNFAWNQMVTVTTGSTVSNTVTVQVGGEIGGELDGIGAKLQGVTSGALSISTQQQTTSSVQLTLSEPVPPCSTVGLYKMARIVELQVDYAYMDDTAFGPMYGYMREMGRGIVRSETATGHRILVASGTQVPVAPVAPVVAPSADPPPLGPLG